MACVYDCVLACVYVCVCVCVANGCTYTFDSLGSEGVNVISKNTNAIYDITQYTFDTYICKFKSYHRNINMFMLELSMNISKETSNQGAANETE